MFNAIDSEFGVDSNAVWAMNSPANSLSKLLLSQLRVVVMVSAKALIFKAAFR